MLDVRIGLSEKQKTFRQSLAEFDVTGYGGAKGGGKSAGARLMALLLCGEVPGTIAAVFRKSFPELRDNHINKLKESHPELMRRYWNAGEKTLFLPNRSQLMFRYCATLADVDELAGREYHKLFIEEAGDWSYEMAIRLIRNCNRSTSPGVRASAALMFNWGGVGHGWLKRIFWDKKLRENEKELTWNFIHAQLEDNPMLMVNDPGYAKRLNAEPNEAIRRAHRYGDANIVAGQFFPELAQDVHIIKPFKIPAHWEWFGAYDYGFGHPAAWGWFAGDGDGNIYLVREHVEAQMYLSAQAAKVHEIERELQTEHKKRSRQTLFWAGHDCWTTKKAGDPTIAEDFMSPQVVGSNQVTLKPANIARKLGASQVRNYLRWEMKDGKRIGPRVFIFSTCGVTIDCISRMIHDPNDIEDVLKVDSSQGDVFTGDDAYDMFRYGLMSRPIQATAPRKPKGTTYDDDERPRRPSWRTV